jgi:hypothetical protein
MPSRSPFEKDNNDAFFKRTDTEKLFDGDGVPSKSSGPIIGVVIIVILMVLGALYFWGARLNQQDNPENALPLIPGDVATTTVGTSSTQ